MQAALGSVVVLTTSTLNRVMVVELALPALLPGALVALHYAVQVLRPQFGYGSDMGGRRTPWIVGGMAALAFGGVAAAVRHRADGRGTWWRAWRWPWRHSPWSGWVSGAAGTSLLVLMAARVDATVAVRRPPPCYG